MVLAAAAFLAAGCGSPSDELSYVKGSPDPVYYLGMKFEGLPLSSAVEFPDRWRRHEFPRAVPTVNVTYGSCPTTSRGSCRPGVSIITRKCGRAEAGVAISALDDERARRAAKRLQPLNAAARGAGDPKRISFGSEARC